MNVHFMEDCFYRCTASLYSKHFLRKNKVFFKNFSCFCYLELFYSHPFQVKDCFYNILVTSNGIQDITNCECFCGEKYENRYILLTNLLYIIVYKNHQSLYVFLF